MINTPETKEQREERAHLARLKADDSDMSKYYEGHYYEQSMSIMENRLASSKESSRIFDMSYEGSPHLVRAEEAFGH